MCAAVALCALLIASPARPQTLSSSTLPPEPVRDPALAGRSVLFDARGAADARVRQHPQYVESIVVEGRDPDGRRPKARPLEQRFADALLAPPPAATAGLRMMDTHAVHVAAVDVERVRQLLCAAHGLSVGCTHRRTHGDRDRRPHIESSSSAEARAVCRSRPSWATATAATGACR